MTNWNRYNQNHFAGIECYRGCDGKWYARVMRDKRTDGPHKTLRAAKLAGYGMLGGR